MFASMALRIIRAGKPWGLIPADTMTLVSITISLIASFCALTSVLSPCEFLHRSHRRKPGRTLASRRNASSPEDWPLPSRGVAPCPRSQDLPAPAQDNRQGLSVRREERPLPSGQIQAPFPL